MNNFKNILEITVNDQLGMHCHWDAETKMVKTT